jgi:hypothetical protein
MLSGLGKVFMRNTVIKDKNGFTGAYYDSSVKGMVQIGSKQSLTFTTETDLKLGPFHLSNSDRESMRADSFVDLSPDKHVSKKLSKSEIIEKLMATEYGKVEGVVMLRSMSVAALRGKAEQLGIAVVQIHTRRKISG